MATAVRRSSRARRPTYFNVGDVVEIKHPMNGKVCSATLLYKIFDENKNAKCNKIRWHVSLMCTKNDDITSTGRDSDSDEEDEENDETIMELQEKEFLRLLDRTVSTTAQTISSSNSSNNCGTGSIPANTKIRKLNRREKPQTQTQAETKPRVHRLVSSSSDSDAGTTTKETHDDVNESTSMLSTIPRNKNTNLNNRVKKQKNRHDGKDMIDDGDDIIMSLLDSSSESKSHLTKMSERERRRQRREALLQLKIQEQYDRKNSALSENNNKNSPSSLPFSPPSSPIITATTKYQSNGNDKANVKARANTIAKQKKAAKMKYKAKKQTKQRKHTSNNKHDPGEECIKVRMNTGTLYLYRGLNRRAVFVRRC